MSEPILENQHGQTVNVDKPASIRQQTEIAALVKHFRNKHKILKENLDRLQESLDNLRLVTKYRAFDLEATRRENAYLRKLLEEGIQ
jgi:hypothetical protein